MRRSPKTANLADQILAKANGEQNLVTSLLTRLARPALAALLLTAIATPPGFAAPSVQTAQSDPFAGFDLMPMFRASATGSFMAGQQALKDLRTDEAARYFFQAAQADADLSNGLTRDLPSTIHRPLEIYWVTL